MGKGRLPCREWGVSRQGLQAARGGKAGWFMGLRIVGLESVCTVCT